MNAPDRRAVMLDNKRQNDSMVADRLDSPLLSALSGIFSGSTPVWIKATTFALLLLGLLLTGFAYHFTRDSAQLRDQLEFDRRVDVAVDEVSVTLHTNAILVVALQGLFRANPDASRVEFHRFAESMQAEERNSNVMAQTWDPLIPRDGIAAFEARVQTDDS